MRTVFVCPHGAAKSVIAAEFFRSMAADRGLSVQAQAFGVEPDPEIPAPVLEGLRRDGLEIAARQPEEPDPNSLAEADLVVLIGCELIDTQASSGVVVRWDGVPAVSDGYDAARTAIVERVEQLLRSLA